MRISDDRYNRDLRRHNLAMRLIRHQARTDTINRWTGLSPFRVRALYHAYLEVADPTHNTRHRGAAPRSLAFFNKSPRHELEALTLAICCHIAGVLPRDPIPDADRTLPSIETGEKLCDAFEAFRVAIAEPLFTIEHAILLTLALARGDELTLGHCERCDGLIIVNRLDVQNPICPYCRRDSLTHKT